MQLEDLKIEYDKLQLKYGAKELDSIYNGGCKNNPDICFVFMNPTGRNIASSKSWKGIKSPWIGTKNIWDLFFELDLMDKDIYRKIKEIKGTDWTEKFAEEVYKDIEKHKYFITNLGKCTQVDARELPDNVYIKYLHLLEKEFEIINPKVIILFGNQVSSIVLNEKISVSKVRKQLFKKKINGKTYNFYSVYYPVGNGRFNINKSIEDIKWIMKNLMIDNREILELHINKELQEYVENSIFPIYDKNDSGHGIEHIKYVIKRSLEFAKQFDDINLNMVYVIASFHDVAHHIDKDNHEILSAKLFYEDEWMKQFFTDEQRKIIKEAIEDHRASLKHEPRSNYGKIISSADKNTDLVSALKRTHAYTIKHYPDMNIDEMINRAYEHISKKFGIDGYAKTYCYDKEFENFKKDVQNLIKNKNDFAVKYKEINKIMDIKDKEIN